jgi:hypothetical protein
MKNRIAKVAQDPVEEVREYILECLRFQQRASRPFVIQEAARQFESVIETAKIEIVKRRVS